MPTRSARPNSWTVVDADDAIRLIYAPQVCPSPLSVSQQGSVQVVITNGSERMSRCSRSCSSSRWEPVRTR